jgi:hypothetical protein
MILTRLSFKLAISRCIPTLIQAVKSVTPVNRKTVHLNVDFWVGFSTGLEWTLLFRASVSEHPFSNRIDHESNDHDIARASMRSFLEIDLSNAETLIFEEAETVASDVKVIKQSSLREELDGRF